MSLVSTNFLTPVVDTLLPEYLRQFDFLNLVMNSPMSQKIMQLARTNAQSGEFVAQVLMPLIQESQTVSFTGSTFATYPSSTPDLTNAYHQITDSTITFNINREGSDQFSLGDRNRESHVLGARLADAQIDKTVHRIITDVETQLFNVGYGSGTYASASVDHALVLTSQANLQAGFAQINKTFEQQNVPMDKRVLALPAVARPVIMQWAGADLKDRNYTGDGKERTGWGISNNPLEYAGCKLVFTQAPTVTAGSGQALGFSPDRLACVMPLYGTAPEFAPEGDFYSQAKSYSGVFIERLRAIQSISDYFRLRMPYGVGVLGHSVSSYFGDTTGGAQQSEGLIRVTVTGL